MNHGKPTDPDAATSGTTKPAPRSDGSSKGISRRALLAGAGAGAVAWSNLTIINKARAAETLRVLAWPGYDEKPVVAEFEEANKVKVEFKNYIGGEQMLQYFGQVPKGTFDAIISDAEYIQKFVAQGVIDPMNPANFKSLADYHPKYRDFPCCAHPKARPGASPLGSAATGSPTTRSWFQRKRSIAGNRFCCPSSRASWSCSTGICRI